MKPIKVLGMSASPRGGNSKRLLEEALTVLSEIPVPVVAEVYSFQGKRIAPCIGCFRCVETQGECLHKDDFREAREKWLSADAIIYSVPVYHMSVPGLFKSFLDRLGQTLSRYVSSPLARHLKVVGVLTVGAHLFGGQELVTSFLVNHAVLMRCIPVAGDGWHSYLGAAGWTLGKRDRDALLHAVAAANEDALITSAAAKSVVKNVVEVAAVVRAGLEALQNWLGKDERYALLFEAGERNGGPR